eukprot:g4639.t1
MLVNDAELQPEHVLLLASSTPKTRTISEESSADTLWQDYSPGDGSNISLTKDKLVVAALREDCSQRKLENVLSLISNKDLQQSVRGIVVIANPMFLVEKGGIHWEKWLKDQGAIVPDVDANNREDMDQITNPDATLVPAATVLPSTNVITGPMFAGKTSRLIEYIELAEQNNWRTLILKPTKDTRCSPAIIRTHDGREHNCVFSVDSMSVVENNIDYYVPKDSAMLVAVDEANFFGSDLVQFSIALRRRRPLASLVVSGLDLDFRLEPFGPILEIISESGKRCNTEKLYSKCKVCGKPAPYSARITRINGVEGQVCDDNNTDVVFIGAEETYAPVCEVHHTIP